MTERLLRGDKDAELIEAFEELERERIGPQKHAANFTRCSITLREPTWSDKLLVQTCMFKKKENRNVHDENGG